MTAHAYSPPRHLSAKLQRRFTQRSAARPATLRFDAPILSITFDDFPASAADVGTTILEAHEARGTFYASAGMADSDGPSGRNFSRNDLARLTERGHEIGCHTYAHADCAKRPVFDTLQDLARNRDALAEMGAAPAQSLAYPYGETSIALKRSLPPRFRCARGVTPGPNHGRTDLAQLRAYALFGAPFVAMRASLKRAARRRAWIIGFTHDVADDPSPWGTRASDLDALLGTARALGFIILPVGAALDRRLT